MSDLPSWLVAIIAIAFPGFGTDPVPVYNGYLEGEYVYVAASGAGRIETIAATEGQQVFEGQMLIKLEDTAEKAALRAAEARVAVAQANLENLLTGSRDAEIEVIRASLRKAETDLHLAQTTLERSKQLFSRDLVPSAQVDNEEAAVSSATAKVAQLRAQLAVAELPARDAQQVAAEATLDAAKAEADQARSRLDDRVILAPATGVVEKVYFDEGEVTGVGTPAMSILPPGGLKVLFFIPEPERSGFAIGEDLTLQCDGCGDGIVATVTRMASEPQHTPPIIYSRDERSRLVFRAEASIEGAGTLLPGQPVSLQRAP